MSLFPAYSDVNNDNLEPNVTVKTEVPDESSPWLTNSSYTTPVITKPVIDLTSESSSDESIQVISPKPPSPEVIRIWSESSDESDGRSSRRGKKKKKEKRSRHQKAKPAYEKSVDNVYFEDTFRDRRNLSVSSLLGLSKPVYNYRNTALGFFPSKKTKKQATPRYYVSNLDVIKKSDTRIKRTSSKKKRTENEETELLDWGCDMEKEQIERTREFNEQLNENPNDIQTWLDYIDFQNIVGQFQKGKGITDDRSMTTCQRKLAIAEKAVEKNPSSTKLLKLKLNLMSQLLPADQFANELEALLNKDLSNVVLWQALIMTTQASVSMCTVPRVLNLYSRCISSLRQRLRINSRLYDEHILEMLYHCLTFLRQAGLWEQMWETIRLNVILNLSLTKEDFRFRGFIEERKLIDMEEVILTSRLPLNQLWLRVESLRESCHWISVDSDQLEIIGDSRRFVLPEDVADFVQPIMSRDSSLKLAVYSILSLKVPMLPMQDFIARELKLKGLDWDTDTLELLLPLLYPPIGIMTSSEEKRTTIVGILEDQLTSGPQYLKFHPAQEPYLDFIRDVFRVVAESFLPTGQERTSIYVWWLRFERLLITLNYDLQEHRKKKLKSMVKDFLKKDENRNNLHFYREYALIERDLGRVDSCVNILETAIGTRNESLSSISDIREKAALCSIFRALFETLLAVAENQRANNKKRLLEISTRIVSGSDDGSLETALEFLDSNVQDFLQQYSLDASESSYFLPSLECDLITCYAYLLYVKNSSVEAALTMLETCLEHSKENPYLQEHLYESTVGLLYLSRDEPGSRVILDEKLEAGLQLYPANCYMLSVYIAIEAASPYWKARKGKNGPWRSIALCLASRIRIHRLETLGLSDAAAAATNKLLSLHRRLARDPDSQKCPLLWRLYMQFLRHRNLCALRGEEIYRESVAQCPWVRGIYTDAAEVAPQILTEVQDLIREKELRMHVTPEELDILRG